MKRKIRAILIFTVMLTVFTLVLAGCGKEGGPFGGGQSGSQYTVSFDSMGGSAVETQTVNDGERVREPNTPTRADYEFVDWYTDRDYTERWYFGNYPSGDMQLFARWKETSVTVSAVTGGTIDDKNITVIVDQDVTELDLNDKITLSSSGASWVLLSERETTQYPDRIAEGLHNGSNKYSVVVRNSLGEAANTYSLEIYKKFTITVKVYGPEREYLPEYDFTLNALDVLTAPSVTEFTGYTLHGWDSDTGEVGEVLPKNATSKINLYANVTAHTFTVTLDANGGKIDGSSTKDVTVAYGTEKRFGKPTLTSYIFDGWYDGDEKIADASGTCAKWTFTEDDMTLTAKWHTYTVTTNTNLEGAGTFTEMNEQPTGVGSNVRLNTTTYKDGYVWLGWYDGDTKVSSGTNTYFDYRMTEESKTFTAKWSKLEIKISDSDRGYTTPYSWNINKAYVAGDKDTFTAITHNGYTFVGWFDGEGEKICDELEIEITMSDVNVYEPRWSKVTLEKNIEEAGTVTKLSGKYTVGEEFTATAVTTLGYNFLGWFEDEEKVSDNLKFTFDMPAEDVTYTAKWSVYSVKVNADPEEGGKASMSFTVNFDVNGGVGEIEPQVATPERGWRYPEIPTRAGYVFKGWFTEPKCENIYDFYYKNPEHNMTLYAGWEEMTAEAPKNNSNSQTTKRKAIDLRDYDSQDYGHTFEQTLMSNSYVYNYNYFTALSDGPIRLYYRAAIDELTNRHSAIYIYVYNETQKKEAVTIKPIAYNSDRYANNTVSWQSESISAEIGDVLYIRVHAQGIYAPTLKMYFNQDTPVTNAVKTDDANIAIGEETTINAVTNKGYTFIGWYDGETKVSDDLNYSFVMTAENREYTAKWARPVVLEKSIEEAGTVAGDNVVTKVGDEITLTATTNAGYTFVGWFDGETLIGRGDKVITVATTDTQIVYTAKWIKVTVGKNIEEAGNITELNGKYVYGENVTVTAATNLGYLWQGWYDGNNKVCNDLEYSFDMPNESKTFTATWEKCTAHTPNTDCVCTKCGVVAHFLNDDCVCTQCGKVDHSAKMEADGYCRHTENGTKYIYMGYYPQSTKAEDVTVTELPDSDGYYGGSDGERYEKYGSNYYKVEPIKWRILKEENGTAMLMSDVILDYQVYQYGSKYGSDGRGSYFLRDDDAKLTTTWAGNYEYSAIRNWLNGTFYEKAFTEAQQAVINTVSVKAGYGVATADYVSQYESISHDNNVYLLALGNLTDRTYGFNASETVADPARALTPSNYSNAKGATGQWMTRTYSGNAYPTVLAVSADGKIVKNANSQINSLQGVVPAVTITLND